MLGFPTVTGQEKAKKIPGNWNRETETKLNKDKQFE